MTTSIPQIALRPATAEDAAAVCRLAALDSAAVPAPPLLLAEAGGTLRAALSTATGAAIADPFYRSAGLVGLLRAHAASEAVLAPNRAAALTFPRRRPRPSPAHC
jgi:hypothetical protein